MQNYNENKVNENTAVFDTNDSVININTKGYRHPTRDEDRKS